MKISNSTPDVQATLPIPPNQPGLRREETEPGAAGKVRPDRVEISPEGFEKARALSASGPMAREEGIDWEKVAAVKQAIAGGSYRPDYRKVAERIMEEVDLFQRR